MTRDGLGNELQREKHQEILIDSFISQSRRAENDRELERWVPEDDDPVCPELENIFDGHWDRLLNDLILCFPIVSNYPPLSQNGKKFCHLSWFALNPTSVG